jgi:hypothetical protein
VSRKDRDYEDILYMPRPKYLRHRRMPAGARAAQFAPFAALTGFDADIDEAARVTEPRRELTEESKAVIDERLRMLSIACDAGMEPEVLVTHFEQDSVKSGGRCVSTQDRVRKVSTVRRAIVTRGGAVIFFDDIYSIDIL